MAKETISRTIQKLRLAGYEPIFVESTDWQVEDDSIRLSETADIQICQDGAFGLGVTEDDGIMQYPYVDTIEEVLKQIKEFEVVI